MTQTDRFARNIPIYYLFQFATGFLIWVPVWIIFLQDERGLSLTQVGLMEAVFWVCMMLFEVPTGAVADRWGRRTSLALGGFLFTGGTIFFVLADGFVGLAISYVIMAISMTLYSGSGHALLFDSLRVLGRTREYEKHMGRSEALMTGALLGAALFGGPMAGLWGLEVVFLIGAGTMAAAGLPEQSEDGTNALVYIFQDNGENGSTFLGSNSLSGSSICSPRTKTSWRSGSTATSPTSMTSPRNDSLSAVHRARRRSDRIREISSRRR